MTNKEILEIAARAGYSHEDELTPAFKRFDLFKFAYLLEQFLDRRIAEHHGSSDDTDDPEDFL